jgi:hypothetical protein
VPDFSTRLKARKTPLDSATGMLYAREAQNVSLLANGKGSGLKFDPSRISVLALTCPQDWLNSNQEVVMAQEDSSISVESQDEPNSPFRVGESVAGVGVVGGAKIG